MSNQRMNYPNDAKNSHDDPREADSAEDRAIPPVLQARSMSYSHPGRALFSNWSAAAFPGVTLVRGDDGSGKSTLLRLLAGQLQADGGESIIRGASLRQTPDIYRSKVFFVDPRTEAFDALTPVQFFDAQRQRHSTFDAQRLRQLVDSLTLEEQMSKQLFMLSTGSKRKVFLAAAFASGAALTLLDMPFAALDKASIDCVMALLEDAASDTERAWLIADYVAPGQVRLAGLIDLDDPAARKVNDFVGLDTLSNQ